MNLREADAHEPVLNGMGENESTEAAIDVTAEPEIVCEQLRLFQAVAGLYQAGIMVLNEQALDDPVLALSQFLFGYAFERQGRSPAYAPIARHVIETTATTKALWQDEAMPQRAWASFCSTLDEIREGARPNPMNNPLCPQGYSYPSKWGQKETTQPSVLEFAQQRLKDFDYNIVTWARRMLLDGQVLTVHGDLRSINGIGPKIASFFLRDIAWCFRIEVVTQRGLLQPIDVWVERTVSQLDPAAQGREAAWIVQESRAAGVLPEAVNAGLWYFGALIAGSEFRLFQALNSPQHARHMVDEHVAGLRKQADAWSHEEHFHAEP